MGEERVRERRTLGRRREKDRMRERWQSVCTTLCQESVLCLPECFITDDTLKASLVVDDLVSLQPLHNIHNLLTNSTLLALGSSPRRSLQNEKKLK